MPQPSSPTIDIENLEVYLDEIQHQRILGDLDNVKHLQQIPFTIREYLRQAEPVSDLAEFFRGEEAFYSGDYKQALKHYLSAKTLSDYQFFCYRTSAYLSQQLGRSKKAIAFARKAVECRDEDYMSLTLLHMLLREARQDEAANSIQKLLNHVIEKHQPDSERHLAPPASASEEKGEPSMRPVGLGQQEIEELSNLFDEHSEENYSMFEDNDHHDTPVQNTPVQTAHQTYQDYQDFSCTTDSAAGFNPDPAPIPCSQAFEELKHLAKSDFRVESESAARFLSQGLGLDPATGTSLEQRMKAFQRDHTESLCNYMDWSHRRLPVEDNCLLVLNGWDYTGLGSSHSCQLPASSSRRTTGGYFLRWRRKGIVINPGPQFLDNFHNHGYHIRDIDFVIVTRDSLEAHADIKSIYDLNYRVNKMDPNNLHIINYYLNQQSHRDISMVLKPHFKQERNTLHCLELYMDSPDLECLDLCGEVSLSYFPPTTPEVQGQGRTEAQFRGQACVGIRLQLKAEEGVRASVGQKNAISVGYVSGTCYSPLLAHHLSGCDILLTGFETTSVDDYSKLKYNPDSLGFFGTQTLVEEVSPPLLISCEFGGREGDIRVEAIKKLRQERLSNSKCNTVALPGDTGLLVSLESLKVRCSVNNSFTDPCHVHVAKTRDSYGKLQYLSPSSFL